MKKTPKVLSATIVTGVIGTTAVWFAPAASAAEGPFVVTDPSQVPMTAVEDEVSKYITENPCDTTRSWVLTTDGQFHPAVTHLETQWSKTVPGIDAEYRYSRTVPGQAAVKGHTYQRVVKGHAATESAKYKKSVTYYTVEHKKVKSANDWTATELAWLGRNATKVGSGPDASSEWILNDAVVNSANMNPFNLPQEKWTDLPSGLAAYNSSWSDDGPSSNDVDYFITKFESYINLPEGAKFYQTHSGTVYLTGNNPNTDFSPKSEDAAWVTISAPAGWTKYETKANGDAVADQTFYYDGSANGTSDPTKAKAQETAPGDPWVAFGNEVTIKEAVPAKTWYYAGSGKDDTSDEAKAAYTATKPAGDWTRFGTAKAGTGTEPKTVYYNPKNPADLSDTELGEDNWTTGFTADKGPDGGWTFVGERTVTDKGEYKDPVVVTTYVYSNGVLCTVDTPPVSNLGGETPTTPPVTVVDASDDSDDVTKDKPKATDKSDEAAVEQLAHTGASTELAVLGAALVAAGMGVTATARRKKA